MNFDVKVLRTPEEQALGVKAFPQPLPLDHVLFFPNVSPGGVITMQGVQEPLTVIILDADFKVIRDYSMQPGYVTTLPKNAAHVVEMAYNAKRPFSFFFLKAYIEDLMFRG